MRKRTLVTARFAKFIEPSDFGSCWNWKGGLSKGGYGIFFMPGGDGYAHRASYLLFKGPIPDGKVVMHSCDNPACVNPCHLLLGTHKDNTQDSIKKGRFRPWGRKPTG